MALLPSPDTVASMLSDPATRIATLDALERHEGSRDAPLDLAAAPVLVELMARDAADVPHADFQRAGLAVLRLLMRAPADEIAALFGTAFGDSRFEAMLSSHSSVVGAAAAKPAEELTRNDALSYACMKANETQWMMRGWSEPMVAAGYTDPMDFVKATQTDPFVK